MRHATLRFQLVKIEIRMGIFFLIFNDACLVKIIKTLKADLHLMGRSKRTSDPLLCEQKELSIVAKSFFILHCALSNLNVNKYGCRSQFVYNFWFPEIWLAEASANRFCSLRSRNHFYSQANKICSTRYVILRNFSFTIDRMIASSAPSSGGRP